MNSYNNFGLYEIVRYTKDFEAVTHQRMQLESCVKVYKRNRLEISLKLKLFIGNLRLGCSGLFER